MENVRRSNCKKAKNVDKFKNLIDQKLFNLKYKLYKYD